MTDLAMQRNGGRVEVPYLAARVSIGDVARAMGKSRTAMYQLWETQHDFWVDLTLYLAYQNDLTQDPRQMPWSGANEDVKALPRFDDVEALEMMRVGGEVGQGIVLDEIWPVVRAGMLGYPDVRGMSEVRQQVENRRLWLLAGFVDAVLTSIGRVAKAPFTAYDLAVVMWCSSEPLSVRNRFVPSLADEVLLLDDGHGQQAWSVLGFALRATLLGMADTVGSADAGVVARTAEPRSAPDWQATNPFERWTVAQREALAAATAVFVHGLESTDDAVEDGELEVLGHVTIAKVARAAGVSRRAIYDLWPTRSAMLFDLLRSEVANRRQRILDQFDRVAGAAPTLDDLPAVIDQLVGPPAHDGDAEIDLVLAFLPESKRAAVRDIVAEHHRDYYVAFGERVAAMAAASGRRIRAGISPEQLATVVLDLVEGGRRMQRTNPTAIRAANARRPTVLGAAALALLGEATVEST